MSASTEIMASLRDVAVRRASARALAVGAHRIAELNAVLRGFLAPLLFALTVGAVLLVGSMSSLERYITPEYGVGYALGIIGGSMMLALLVYPLRKRFRSLRWMGPVKYWFRTHMVFGILGPSLILFHCNFSFGATNSNVALIAMLTVAGSGIIGRYFYSRTHQGLYGAKVQLGQMQHDKELARRGLDTLFAGAPALRETLVEFERVALDMPHGLMARASRLLILAVRTQLAYREAMRIVSDHLHRLRLDRSTRRHLYEDARGFLRVYFDAVRKVAETAFYERLFSMWHVLHVPLFVMLIVTAVFHIIAVHVY